MKGQADTHARRVTTHQQRALRRTTRTLDSVASFCGASFLFIMSAAAAINTAGRLERAQSRIQSAGEAVISHSLRGALMYICLHRNLLSPDVFREGSHGQTVRVNVLSALDGAGVVVDESAWQLVQQMEAAVGGSRE